jgi:hypothetical protein
MHIPPSFMLLLDAAESAAGVLFFGFLIGAVGEFLEVGSSENRC